MLAGVIAEGLYFVPHHQGHRRHDHPILEVDVNSLRDIFSPDLANITCRVYNPGAEATETETVTYLIFDPTHLRRTSGTHPAWVAANKTRVTFTDLGGGNNAGVEAAFLFQTAARSWGARAMAYSPIAPSSLVVGLPGSDADFGTLLEHRRRVCRPHATDHQLRRLA
ncbi:MAG: hypothetical protein U1F43_26200 [Myxococcota bacterium]